MNSTAAFTAHEVIILAGGLGKRLGPALGGLPKPMVSVSGKPFLEWMLLYLRSAGFRSFIISVGYRRGVIKDYFRGGERWGAVIRYAEEESPLGTGGALKRALSLARTPAAFVSNGDSLCMCDIADFFRSHRESGGAATVCCVRVDDTSRYGSVAIGAGSRMEAFTEKGGESGEGYINSGMYWMKKSFADVIGARAPLSLEKDVFPRCGAGVLYAYRSDADFTDIGTAGSLAEAPAFLERNGFLQL